MCALELNEKVPTKSRDAGTAKLFNASLPVSKAFAFFSIVHCGKNIPVEKHQDEAEGLISASQYCLSPASMQLIMQADNVERHTYISGLAKIAQQVTRYLIYGLTINYICDKVLTQHDVYPSEDVKLHLVLTGEHFKKSFMDM